MKNLFCFLLICIFLASCTTVPKKSQKEEAQLQEAKKDFQEIIKKQEELAKKEEKAKDVLPVKKPLVEEKLIEEKIKEEKPEEKNISFNFKNAEIKSILQFMAKQTNRIVIMDEKIKGKITVKTGEKLTLSEAFVVLMALLESKGLTLIKTDKFLKIAKKKEAIGKPVETFFGADPAIAPDEDRVITQIIPIEHTKSKTILAGIKPLISRTGHVFDNDETNFIVITDVASNIKRIMHIIKRLDVKIIAKDTEFTKVYMINNLKAEEISTALTAVFGQRGGMGGGSKEKKVKITTLKSANAIIVTAVTEMHSQIKSTLKKLDVRQMQVLIEVKIIEATYSSGLSFGIQLEQVLNQGSGETSGKVVMGGRMLDKFISFTANNSRLTAAIDALAKNNLINILSTPRLLTSDNKKASITVGREQPILKSVTDLGSTGGGEGKTVSDYEYKDIGIELEITPSINANRDVYLDISFKVTSILYDETFPGNVHVPVVGKREAKTSVTILDNHTLILGGLIRDSFRDERQKVPFLGDIPILGVLFSHIEKINEKTELLIFLTPHVIANSEEGTAITQSERDQMGNKVEEVLEDKQNRRNSLF